MPMRKSRVSLILISLCILLVGNSIFYFVVPIERDEMILEGNFGIVENLKIPFHAFFRERSQNQSIVISLTCSEGSIDLVVLESTEWESWYNGSEYTALYEWTNTSFVDTVIPIHPLYKGYIDIFIATTYGDVTLASASIHSHSMSYDDNTAVLSLFGAISFVLVGVWYHYSTKGTNKFSVDAPDIS